MIRPKELMRHEPLTWSPGMGTDVWDLFCAAIVGDVAKVNELLDRDPSLVRAAYDYRTPMYFAVREGQLRVAEAMLARGAGAISSGTNDTLLEMARDRGDAPMIALLEGSLAKAHGMTPGARALMMAIRAHDEAEMRRLLDQSPELLHAADENGNLAIHLAVMTRQPALIDELAQRGADLDARRPDGARPIQLVNGDYGFRGWRDVPANAPSPTRILEQLRALGATADLCTASYIGDIARVRELLDADPSLANRASDYVSYYDLSGTPLRNAAAGGHIEIVRLLLASGADPNLPEEGIAPRGHALHTAVVRGHRGIVELLLAHGAHPNVDVESSGDTIGAAMARGDQAMVDLLYAHGATRSLTFLAYLGDVRAAASMFENNPALADDPDAVEVAAGQGNDEFVRLMLRHVPNLATRIAVGVRSQGPTDFVKTRALAEELLARGMDVSHTDWLHIAPLHRMAQRGDAARAFFFLERGADIEARDKELRTTPLGWAAKFGHALVAELLLRRGARPRLGDGAPWTEPLAWATRRGHARIAAMIETCIRDGVVPAQARLDEYERVAATLAEAFSSGTDAALREVAAHLEMQRVPTHHALRDQLRFAMRRDDPALAETVLDLNGARDIVARLHGVADWNELARLA